ncbi:MAG: hypothetical protein Q9163_002434 [Psora crenata]
MDKTISDGRKLANGGTIDKHILPGYILQALEAKRKQFDVEIKDYTIQKEQEYQEFERKIWAEFWKGNCNEIPRGAALGQASKLVGQDSPAPGGKGTRNRDDNGSGALQDSKNPRTTRSDTGKDFGGFPGPPNTCKNEGETREWEGIFTPEYLPLLEGHKNGRNFQKETSSSIPPREPAQPTMATLSSSAEDHPPSAHTHFVKLSAPYAQLSSSAPPTEDIHHSHSRSDSSTSNVSVASLRSSMRDPRQPRSPKRVLFSLGDAVVSPSTSPILSRISRNTELTIDEGERVEDVFAWGKKWKVRRNRRKGSNDSANEEKERGREGREELEDIGISEGRGMFNLADGWTKTIPVSVIQDNNHAIPMAATADGFEKVEKADDEDLFTFDEDLNDNYSKAPLNNGSLDSHMFDEDDNDHDKEPLPGTSPHAGSLPIEIKWPGRSDAGGNG